MDTNGKVKIEGRTLDGESISKELIPKPEPPIPPPWPPRSEKLVQERSRSEHINNAHLFVIGKKGGGKTTLLRALSNNAISGDDTNKDNKYLRWSFMTKNGMRFTVNCTEFSHEDISSGIYRIYIAKYALYLLVSESGMAEMDVEFEDWLTELELTCEPVQSILVLSQKDNNVEEIDFKSIEQKFTNVVGGYRIDLKTGMGIDVLRKSIEDYIVDIYLAIHDQIPKNAISFIDSLFSKNKAYLGGKDIQDAAKEYGLSAVDIEFLILSLHNMGEIFYFKNNAKLKELIFLDKGWIISALHEVFRKKLPGDSHHPYVGKDFFYSVWGKYSEKESEYLLELMKHFDLCFPLAETEFFFVPVLAPSKRPDFEWNNDGNLTFEYQYEFLPSNIFFRFAASAHKLVKDGLLWKNGVFLQDGQSEALVCTNPQKRKVVVKTNSSMKSDLFWKIGVIFADIHKQFKCLNVICQFKEKIDEGLMFELAALAFQKIEAENQSLDSVTKKMGVRIRNLSHTIDELKTTIESKNNIPDQAQNIRKRIMRAQELGKSLQERKFQIKISPEELVNKLKKRGFWLSATLAEDIIKKLEAFRIVVLQGVTGTGKTILAKYLSEIFLKDKTDGKKEKFTRVQVYPELTSYDSIGGLRMIKNYFVPHIGWLTDSVMQSIENEGEHWLVLDEINRCDISALLGSALDDLDLSKNKESEIVHPNLYPDEATQAGSIPIPSRFRIIGTMNPFDKELLFEFTNAFNRRIGYVEIPPLQIDEERDCIEDIVIKDYMEQAKYKEFSKFMESFQIQAPLEKVLDTISKIRELAKRKPKHFYQYCELGTSFTIKTVEDICKSCLKEAGKDGFNGDLLADAALHKIVLNKISDFGRQALRDMQNEIFLEDWAPKCFAKIRNYLEN